MFAVHAVDGVLLAEQRRADFQRGEMRGHEDHAFAFALSLLQMFKAFDVGQFRQTLARPPPAHRHFKKGDAGGGEVFLEQAFALSGGLFREAQFQIAPGDGSPVAGDAIHQRAQNSTDGQQRRIRQLHDQPQKPQAAPERPEARSKICFSKTRAIH